MEKTKTQISNMHNFVEYFRVQFYIYLLPLLKNPILCLLSDSALHFFSAPQFNWDKRGRNCHVFAAASTFCSQSFQTGWAAWRYGKWWNGLIQEVVYDI